MAHMSMNIHTNETNCPPARNDCCRHQPYGPYGPYAPAGWEIAPAHCGTKSERGQYPTNLCVQTSDVQWVAHGGEMPTVRHQAGESPAPTFEAPQEKRLGKHDHREKKPWTPIDTTWLPRCHEMATFPAGFKVNVYDGRLTNYFEVPSEWIAPTHGGMRYVEHFNETGPYSRFRFQLCHNFLNGRCNKGFNCTYVHANQLPTAHEIHVQGMDAYERLPAGLSLFVNMPGSTGRPQMVPSQYIIRTVGSERLYTDVLDNKHGTFVRPQHCAHFLFKKLCNLGPKCAFIHVIAPAKCNAQNTNVPC
jgi:hypothetical protein